MPTVVSATVSTEHSLKHHYDTTKGLPVTKPSMMLDISIKFMVFILRQKLFVLTSR